MRQVIVNITPQEYFFQRTHGYYHILPATKHYGEPGFSPGITIIEDSRNTYVTNVDSVTGNEIKVDVPLAAEKIAADLLRNEDLEKMGCFVSESTKPSDRDMQGAYKTLLQTYREAVAEANMEWQRTHRYEFISDLARRGARHMGMDVEWSDDVKPKIDCPGCGERIPATVARHTCGAIIDIDRAESAGMIDGEEAKRLRKLRSGKKPKVEEEEKEKEAVQA